MNTKPENPASTSASDECYQMLNVLLLSWPEEPRDDLSSALLHHLCHCRSCLRKWIALEAAADLASLSIIRCNEFSADVDDVVGAEELPPPKLPTPTHVG